MAKKKTQKEEIMDMITEDDEVIGTMTRSEMRTSNLLHRGVIIFVFTEKGKLLLQKRSKNKDIEPGMWDVSCGGGVKAGETFEDACERELYEELGISAPATFITKFRYKDDKTNYIGHLYAICYEGKIKYVDHEVESAKFCDMNELKKMFRSKDMRAETKKLIGEYIEDAKELALG